MANFLDQSIGIYFLGQSIGIDKSNTIDSMKIVGATASKL